MKNLKPLVESYNNIVIISVSFRMAKSIVNTLFDELSKNYNVKISRNSDHSCITFGGDVKCKITALASSVNCLRGYRPDLVLIDRYSFFNGGLTEDLLSILSAPNYPILLENF